MGIDLISPDTSKLDQYLNWAGWRYALGPTERFDWEPQGTVDTDFGALYFRIETADLVFSGPAGGGRFSNDWRGVVESVVNALADALDRAVADLGMRRETAPAPNDCEIENNVAICSRIDAKFERLPGLIKLARAGGFLIGYVAMVPRKVRYGGDHAGDCLATS